MIDVESLPETIRTTERAVVWKSEERDGKTTKVPYRAGQPNEHAAVNNPDTWGNFETAAWNVMDGKADGAGFVLGDGIAGVDLDGCRDPDTGELEPWAWKIVDRLDSYTEVSPSGTGVHVIARGVLPDGRRRKGPIEMYSDGRYFTVTGDHLEGTPEEIRERTADLAAVHAEVFETNGDRGDGADTSKPPAGELNLSDRELVERAKAASNGDKFARLWAGDTSGYPSPSEADLALVNLLAFWTRGDADRIDSLFRQCGLMRQKWTREDYRERTISAALDGRTDYWEPTRGDGSATNTDRAGGGADTEEQENEELTLTDAGNSERLVAIHGDRLHYLPEWSKWIVEEDGFWGLDHDDVQVRELAKDVGRHLKQQAADEEDSDRSQELFKWGLRSLSSGRISAMVNLARGVEGVPLPYRELDTDGWLLGVQNGVVDLETGRLRSADPGDLITKRCPVRYDRDAEAPRWQQALREWFPDDDLRGYVKRVAGAALVGGQQDHVLIIHYGTGRNGKGTFVRALQNVLGDYAGVAHLSLLVQQKHSEHDTVKADLFRKRLAVASETERRVKLREASVKNLTGGDRITARRMREDPWEFEPTHSIWLQTNHLPEIQGRDRGIWSRIRVVKWESVFTGEDADPKLDEKLADEAPGILRWLVEGCLKWQQEGLDEPETVKRETLDYRQSEDKLARFRADVGLAFSPELEVQAGELQDILTNWANEEGVRPPRQEIGDWLRENGCEKKQKRVEVNGKTKRPRFWQGAGIPGEGHKTDQTDALS